MKYSTALLVLAGLLVSKDEVQALRLRDVDELDALMQKYDSGDKKEDKKS